MCSRWRSQRCWCWSARCSSRSWCWNLGHPKPELVSKGLVIDVEVLLLEMLVLEDLVVLLVCVLLLVCEVLV